MKEILSFTLRIDKKLHEKILRIAEEEKRSLNSEILYILEEYIKEKGKKENE